MYRKIISLLLVGLILNLTLYSTVKADVSEKDAKLARKIKSEITELGTGVETTVSVKQRDKTKINGYVDEIGKDDFTVIDRQTKQPVKVPYSQVKQIRGKNFLTGKVIVFGLLIAFVVLWLVSIAISDTGS